MLTTLCGGYKAGRRLVICIVGGITIARCFRMGIGVSGRSVVEARWWLACASVVSCRKRNEDHSVLTRGEDCLQTLHCLSTPTT